MNLEEKFQDYKQKTKELKRLGSKKERYTHKAYNTVIYGILSFGALIVGGITHENFVMCLGVLGCIDNWRNFFRCADRYKEYNKQYSRLEKEIENGN